MSTHKLIPIGPDAPNVVRTIVEVPKGVCNKYKYHAATNTFRHNRTLFSPLHYPYEYGWICGTKAPSGDRPMSCLVITKNPTFTGCMIEARPIAALRVVDNEGADPKVLCVAMCDPRVDYINSLSDLSEYTATEVEHFFEIYKTLEKQEVQVDGWMSTEETLDLIRANAIDPATGELLFAS
jgi:inorganic pyrophosphatase